MVNNNNAEENYKKFQQSLCQYLSKPVEDFASVKPQILKILQTHRPIRVGDYEYGISKAGKKRCQLIVHEFNDRSVVREYFKSGKNVWRCCECHRTAGASDDSTLINDLLIEHGIVFVKSEHECKPRQHSFVLNVQKYYSEGKFDEANSLQKSVLGSEDSNVLLKQKKAVARKSSQCLKGTEEVAADVSLQCAQEKNKDVQHRRSSFMDRDYNVIPEALSPEAAFKEIIENLKEYTNEKVEVVLLNKSKILSVLKANRPIKMNDYFYGLSQECKINQRLIVFEFNDRKGVREYSKRNDKTVNIWNCCECHKLWKRHRLYGEEEHKQSYLRSICDIKFVQIKHDCLPRSYRLVMQMQNFLEKKEKSNAKSMTRTTDYTVDESYFANIVNVLDVTSSSKPENTNSSEKRKEVYENESGKETFTNLKRKIQSDTENDRISSDNNPSLKKKSKLIDSTSKNTVKDENGIAMNDEKISFDKISKREKNEVGYEKEEPSTSMYDNEYSSLINDESQSNKKKSIRKKKNSFDEENNSLVHQKSEADVEMEEKPVPTTFAFVKPSTSALKEICTKLKIQYRNQVTKLWDKIVFEQIDTVSMPTDIQTHNFKTDNFYEILSMFFTGKSTQHEQIQKTIIEAFRQKLVVDLEELSSKKFDKLYSKSNIVTDKLLSFIARFIKCRVLISDGEEMKKYGKWNSHLSNRLTLVLSLSDDLYSIVLNL